MNTQYSPDGVWWWDGSTWRPTFPRRPTFPPGRALRRWQVVLLVIVGLELLVLGLGWVALVFVELGPLD